MEGMKLMMCVDGTTLVCIPGFYTDHTVDGLWEAKAAQGRLKQSVPRSPTPSRASRTTPSAYTVPSWKAFTPSVLLMASAAESHTHCFSLALASIISPSPSHF